MFLFTLSPKNAEDFYIKAQATIENDNIFSLILAPIPNSSEILSSHTLFTHSARRPRNDHPAPESFDASLFYHADSNGFLALGNNNDHAPAAINRALTPQKAPQFHIIKTTDNYYKIHTTKENIKYYLYFNNLNNEINFLNYINDDKYLWITNHH
ncbi:hypothetical protein K1X45_01610 [Pseudochrobactrum sp. Wa41.01b-1]|uniref:hypothetical protein n=1 Tax=Pseudochrobactrum sp. Wa41.01b-1 TaxID=2864102 RepID=UPI001C689747|nr:hypothetical protein [Pseudochrobactrum sp. Wa41.01b-1]QYM73175.1 hypothetical protein K1X45_01610 [Pseudochrobactrum sp. Wa41.01b-1]